MPIDEQVANDGVAITDQIMQRMREVLEVGSDYKLAKLIGKSTGALSNWRRRGTIPIDECISLSVSHGVSLDWLILGHGAREPDSTPSEPQGMVASTLLGERLCAVPLYDIEAAAGAGRVLEAEEVASRLYLPAEQLAEYRLEPANVVGVRVSGDSMETTLTDGDWVLVDRSDRPERPEGVFLLRVEDALRIKRVQRVAGGGWFLISDNRSYDRELIPPEKMDIVELLGRCVMKIGRIS